MKLRKAKPQDRDLVLLWRSDPEARQTQFTDHDIGIEEHAAWYERKLHDADALLLIAEVDGEPIGMVRFDREGAEAEVSIALALDARGRGYGVEALQLASTEAEGAFGVDQLVARVKPQNERSLRLFERAGFSVDQTTDEVVRLSRAASG